MKRNKVNHKLSCRVTQRCALYCTFCFAVLNNVTYFGNLTESGQIHRNSQQVVLCFSGNNVSVSINTNFFMSNMNLVCGLNSITCQARKKIKFHPCSFLNINVKHSLPADILRGLFVTHSFFPHGRGGEMNA